MLKKIIFLLLFIVEQRAYAGGDWAAAEIRKLSFNGQGKFVVEFDWIGNNGFLSESEFRKFVFELHNWPKSSHRWFARLLPWVPKDIDTYPLKNVIDCKNLLLTAYEKKHR